MKTYYAIPLLTGLLLSSATTSLAQVPQDDEVVIVTGMRVTQGGAQDINFFRGEVELGHIPHANTFTSEGLLSQHDLILPSTVACEQTLCLTGESMRADMIVDTSADYFMGLGFDTNIDEKTWKRSPLNLVAVIDKSGSMSGTPLENVKKSLKAAVKEMGAGDQLSIILYGSQTHVHMSPTEITRSSKRDILNQIDLIVSEGSTYMEAGLKLGFETAAQTKSSFDGTTRLMLFTDERPNVGNTDADSFMGMAKAASQDGVGMTTIGVGVQFGAELATKVSSVSGGNLFFVRDETELTNLFKTEFDFMVSEIAHDMKVSVTPAPGLKIAGIYGVPQDMFTWQDDRSVEMVVPTAFLSSNGGGLFMTLSRENPNLPLRTLDEGITIANVDLRYLDGATQRFDGQMLKANLSLANPSENLQKSHLIVDEFAALQTAANAHHIDNNQELAYQTVRALSQKLNATKLPGLEKEKTMVAGLEGRLGLLSGHGEEMESAPPYVKLWNKWRITSVNGSIDLRRGDVLDFSPDQELTIFRRSKSLEVSDETENYSFNEKQVYFDESEIAFYYRVSKRGNLTLTHVKDELTIRLRPVKRDAS